MKKSIPLILSGILICAGFAVLILGMIFFTLINSAILFNVAGFCVIFFGTAAVGTVLFFLSGRKERKPYMKKTAIAAITVEALLLVITIILAFAVDLFQPLALSLLSSVLLIAGGVITTAGAVLGLIFNGNAVKITVVGLTLCSLFLGGIIWANTQGYGDFYNAADKKFLFVNGEGGYATFRIPSLYVVDKDVLNEKSGTGFSEDLIIAMAEGRKNSSLDIGEIDIVYKISADEGKTWTDLRTLIKVEGEVGKAGNPTVVFDKVNGILNVLYMVGTEKNGYNYIAYNVQGTINGKGEITLGTPIRITEEYDENAGTGIGDGVNEYTLMIGPGKAVQTESGRLIVPCSNRGYSFALYSDDYGKTWTRGKNACEGNECEIAVLPDGRLVMVSRDNTGAGNFHPKQFIRLVYSSDNGETWGKVTEKSNLKTPICMSSVDVCGNTLYLTFPDDYYTRANLTVAYSEDGGETFEKKVLYDGPGGYSCVTSGGNGKVFVIAEVGKVNYNEALVFFRIDIMR